MNLPNITVAIPFSIADWNRADALIDWHRELNGGRKLGHVILAASTDAHAEIRLKLKIAAELAFETVTEWQAPKSEEGPFHELALYIGRSTRWPWFFCEPTCVPLCADWIQALLVAYESQPMRYMGKYVMLSPKEGEEPVKTLFQNAVYPFNAINDISAKRVLLSMSSESRLVQVGNYDDKTVIRPDAVVFSGCKDDALIERLNGKRAVRQELVAVLEAPKMAATVPPPFQNPELIVRNKRVGAAVAA